MSAQNRSRSLKPHSVPRPNSASHSKSAAAQKGKKPGWVRLKSRAGNRNRRSPFSHYDESENLGCKQFPLPSPQELILARPEPIARPRLLNHPQAVLKPQDHRPVSSIHRQRSGVITITIENVFQGNICSPSKRGTYEKFPIRSDRISQVERADCRK